MLVLLAALWAVKPGIVQHDFLTSAALLGLSLLPIGYSLRLSWLRFGAVAWAALLGLLAWQRSHLGAAGDGVGSLAILPLVLAAFAAAGGQWLNLGLLRVGRLNGALRWLARASILFCLLLLLTYLGGGIGVVIALALLVGSLADLALTTLSLVIGAIAITRSGRKGEAPPVA
ncbi:hypothetical protein [Synechococcus sp. CS-1328]|uniref:hypothetical protein n=1 Tax=Synechococcus sp. CS-1328 TaxID=2847976 RepID=UPI00223C1A8F|nr:hypothetical protein [Synechococcus sp. CS-1328]MCT0224882.1 hypothetical protein [Synechococcus sp. CS-1328]